MSAVALPATAPHAAHGGWRQLVADWSSDRQTFNVAWGKAMMWIFLLSDTFIFGCFLTGYMTVRASTTVACSRSTSPWIAHWLSPSGSTSVCATDHCRSPTDVICVFTCRRASAVETSSGYSAK